MAKYPIVLTIAGSDSSGGAGIQADIKTMSAIGVYAASAVTAVTAQNTLGVTAVQGIDPDIVARQIDAVFSDLRPDAVKIGMLYSRSIVEAVADRFCHWRPQNVVLNPVMVSTSGCRLMQEDALEIFIQELLPLASLLTPNIPEAEILAGRKIQNVDDIRKAAASIIQLGCNNVLIKGGHFEGTEKMDYLFENKQHQEANKQEHTGDIRETAIYKGATVNTCNTHGTGCTLSSAITSYLARGYNMEEAISSAKAYLSDAIEAGKDVKIGEGHGPVNHFHAPQKLYILTDEPIISDKTEK